MDTARFVPEYRREGYKNKDRFNPGEVRRRRDQFQVKLRKQRQYELLEKRRRTESAGSGSNNDSSHYDSEDNSSSSTEELQVELNDWGNTLVKSNDLQEQLGVLVKIRNIVTLDPGLMLQDQSLGKVIEIMTGNEFPMLQHEALWIITNLSGSHHDNVKTLISYNIISILVNLLDNTSCKIECKEQAIWALGNIAGDCPEYRKMIYNHKPNVLRIFMWFVVDNEKTPVSLLKVLSWTLSNILRVGIIPGFDDVNNFDQCNSDLMTVIKTLLEQEQDEEIISNTCWTISYMNNINNNEKVNDWIIESNLVPRLIEIWTKNLKLEVFPILKIIGNIVCSNEEQTQYIINMKVLPVLKMNLETFKGDEFIIKEIFWIMSNIAAGSKTQLESLLQLGCIDTIIEFLNSGTYLVKKEICWLMFNMMSHESIDIKTCQYLVAHGGLLAIYSFLKVAEPNIQDIILSTLAIILKFGRIENELNNGYPGFNKYSLLIENIPGVDILQYLQCHSVNSEVSSKAAIILDTFFGESDEDSMDTNGEPNLQPGINGNQFDFRY